MKTRSKHSNLKRKNEIRFHKVQFYTNNGKKKKIFHPAFIFFEKGNLYVYVTITHSSKIQNRIVLKLMKNPNPHDERDSFWIAEIREDTKERFTRRQNGWKVSSIDIEKIIEFYNQKK